MKRVLFLGTPRIAAVVLSAIYQLPNVQIVGVFCQPDKQLDRKGRIVYSEVKRFALEHALPCFQPENINHDISTIKALQPDIIITCAYGQFISETILSIPPYHCVNFHASLLPALRGGAPIHWAIIKGYSQTGWTLMFMAKKMDAGNIIKKYPLTITAHDTYSSLYDKLCAMLPSIVQNDFMMLFDEHLVGEVQDEQLVTFGYNIQKSETYINFDHPAQDIINLIRGLNEKPGARFIYHGQEIKVYEATIVHEKSIATPGTILDINQTGIKVATKEDSVLITKLQLPSKKAMEVKDLIHGHHPFVVGEVIGE